MHPRLRGIVKAYDVRGASPGELDVDVARALGAAFAAETGIDGGRGRAVVGRDMRATSPQIAEAISDGIRSVGGGVVDIGLASTDLLYCASGVLDLPGVMVTASHNPAGDNGLKMCRAAARPIGLQSGLAAIAETAGPLLDATADAWGADHDLPPTEHLDFLPTYVETLLSLAPVRGRRLEVAVDAGNGMAGHTVPGVFERLDVDLVPLYLELDGTFPNHEANPLDSSTLVDLQRTVRERGCDIGLAFDGDADRCFVVDERGDVVTPSAIIALVAARHLAIEPGATVLHNVICSRAVPEIITERGGTAVRTPVGHSLIKAEMARTGAVFGGEHSGHFYFREFYLADSGMLAALHVMAALAEASVPLSSLMAEYSRYAASGEINSRVADADALLEAIARRYADHRLDRLDGLTVEADDWWFNVRASNTEPLLRLNVEGADEATMTRVRDEVLALVRAGHAAP